MLINLLLLSVAIKDEVESITTSRIYSTSANEPADAIRAVNALLTGLDKLRSKNNVLIFTTSNLMQNMDEAFLDRVDLSIPVSSPSLQATYTILRTCFLEMIRCKIFEGQIVSWRLSSSILDSRFITCMSMDYLSVARISPDDKTLIIVQYFWKSWESRYTD